MTTLEQTISLIKFLPEADLLKVQALARQLQGHRQTDSSLRVLSREEFLGTLEKSRNEFANGNFTEAQQALNEIWHEHHL